MKKKAIMIKPEDDKNGEHNKDVLDALDVFSKIDMTSSKPYFCFFKKNNGEAHILTNIANKKNLDIMEKSFKDVMKEWRKELRKNGMDK